MDPKSDPHEYCSGGYKAEDIVISGISGRFPNCETVGELKEALYAQKELFFVDNIRFPKGPYNNNMGSSGSIQNLDKFESDYFCLSHNIIHCMDPQVRKLLEVCYEAIADAGYDPAALSGSKIGVYNSHVSEDSLHIGMMTDMKFDGFSWLKCMNANRINYHFNFTGPSVVMDAACASSSAAFYSAFRDLMDGKADAALVCAAQVNLLPELVNIYNKVSMLSLTGTCKPFDARANGTMRAEGAAAIFLQKASVARRAYASVPSVGYLCSGYVPEGISVPSYKIQVKLNKLVLDEAGIKPEDVDYIEAHGTGTPVGDPIELNALGEIYCTDKRKTPLHVGTIKSNIGHTEAVSGLCGVIKSIFSFEEEKIPPNFDFQKPNPKATPLITGKMKVVTEAVPLKKPYIPVNSFGIGGTMIQIMLKQNPISYTKMEEKKSSVPQLVLNAATCESAIQYLFDKINNRTDLTDEFFTLLNKLAYCSPNLKSYRGYALLYDKSVKVSNIQFIPRDRKQTWFIYTGMGCQWKGMAQNMMKIESFAKSFKKSAQILKPHGVDIMEVIKPDSTLLETDRLLHPALATITVIQVALTDVLKELGIEPDGIIGHSTGEVAAAYADGCLTHEETVLAAYYRGLCVEKGIVVNGAMAAVGLSWEQAHKLCPKNVYPACDNADDSVTISGTKEDVENFVAQLKKQNIFAKEVNAYGYPFHSRYMEPIADLYRSATKNVFKNPKERSSRWLSTSFPEENWDHPSCKRADAEYFIINSISPVRFNEAIKKVPQDAVLIEIGPHHLLQSLLKRAVGPDSVNVGLMKRNEPDNVSYFLEAIGKLYMAGLDPQIERLYPPVKFPVPRKTPNISELIQWNHTQSFNVRKWQPNSGEISRQFNFSAEDSYLLDHFIDGRSLFPATGYLVFAWEMFARKLQKNFNEMPVIFENFKIYRATVITNKAALKLNFNLLNDSKHFEILEGNSLIASGQIHEWKNGKFLEPEPTYSSSEDSSVQADEVYNELKMRGYEYGPEFQRLQEINLDGTQGLVSWNNEWTSFLDALLLFFGIITNPNEFYLPTGILSVKIDPRILVKKLETNSQSKNMPVNYNPDTQICRSVGVELSKMATDVAPHRVKDVQPTLEEYTFVPYVYQYELQKETCHDLIHYMWICNQVMDIIGRKMGMDFNGNKFQIGQSNGKNYEIHTAELTERHVLLKCLNEMSENAKAPKSKLKEIAFSYFKNIENDFINTAMFNGYALKIMLEIIAENSFRKASVLEINEKGTSLILPNIDEMSKKFSNLRYKTYSLITNNKSIIDSEIINSHNIHVSSMETISKLSEEKSQDVVISSFGTGSLDDLRHSIKILASVVKDTGFILFYHKEKISPFEEALLSLSGGVLPIQSRLTVENVFQENKLTVISVVFDIFGCAAYLLRPARTHKVYQNVIKVSDSKTFSWVDELRKHLENNSQDILWLVSEEDPTNGIVGMVNCLKQEPGGERIRCVFICSENGQPKLPTFSLDESFFKPLLTKNIVMNVWKNGAWGSFRHILMKDKKQPKRVEHSYVNCKKYGDLSSFEWVESHVKYSDISGKKQLVHIYYSAMNFRDVMLATGKLSIGAVKSGIASCDDSVLGLEYSGRDQSGNRVAGITPSRGMATAAVVDPVMMIEVPDQWSLEEAATVPVVYATCYYALVLRARIRKGQSILIHSATGGIGIAAVRIALSYQCEIFVTVGNNEKRKYLRKLFPDIKEENIGCSRDVDFENMVMKQTKGKGVNIVLNSLADDKFQASVRCVSRHGQFLEIGKYDLSLDRTLGLKQFLRNISFHAVMLDQLFDDSSENREEFQQVMDLVKEGIKAGVVKPLDRTVFKRDQIESAFRYMAKGVHVGKVVLKIREEEQKRTLKPQALSLPAVPNTYFYPRKVYIVIGGLGGFGTEVTKWILERGGNNILLSSRCGPRMPYHKMCLQRWNQAGNNVQVSTLDVSKREEARQLLKEALKIGPVGGIINSAAVLKDAFMDCQTPESFKVSCAPKGDATKILDELSRELCPNLDLFVCFSSISCGRGNAGQTNYGYSNSVMERVCEQRRKDGLHGLAIQWGIIGEVGLVHRHMGEDAMIAGVRAQNVKSCLETLDLFCQVKVPVVTSYVTAVTVKKSTKKLDIVSQITKVLGMKELTETTANRPFSEMGIDSLMGVEIKQLVESQLDVSLNMQELLELKINDLKELAKNLSKNSNSKDNDSSSATLKYNFKFPSTLINTDPVVHLNSATKGVPVFIMNIENVEASRFKLLAESLSVPVFLLQKTKSTPLNDMEALTIYCIKMIQSKTSGPFHLIGCSNGGCVSFDVALKEHKKNLKSLTLIDGSKYLIKVLNKEADTKHAEISGLCNFVKQFSADDLSELEDVLKKALTSDDRIKIVLNLLSSSSKAIDKTDLNAALNDFLKLVKLNQSYSPGQKLPMDVLLVEDPMKVLPNDVSEIKSSMSQLCNGKIVIQRVLSTEDLSNKDLLTGLLNILKDIIS